MHWGEVFYFLKMHSATLTICLIKLWHLGSVEFIENRQNILKCQVKLYLALEFYSTRWKEDGHDMCN